MKYFDITFTRTIQSENGKKIETRKVTGVKAQKSETAQIKAFRKICFYTKYDHWKFSKAVEVKEPKVISNQEELL